MSGTALFWLAPCLPLVAFALLAVGLSRFGRLASGLAVAAMAGASIVSAFGLLSVIQGERAQVSLPWLSIGGRQLTLALWLDPLSGLLATVVSLVGLIVVVAFLPSSVCSRARCWRWCWQLTSSPFLWPGNWSVSAPIC
jgi:formate hydrogenlyase subunit 3/multisubunit Na+/H+ antiporter MnhD subunit